MDEPDESLAEYNTEIRTFLQQSQWIQAKYSALEALSRYPGDRELLLAAHTALRACNELSAALEHAKELITLYPSYCEGYCRTAQDLWQLGRQDEALETLAIGIERWPDTPEVLSTALTLYSRSELHEKAVAAADKLYYHCPDCIQLYTPYVTSLYRLGQDSRAEEVIESAIDRFPDDFTVIRLKLDLLLSKRQDLTYRNWLYALARRTPEFGPELIERIHRFEHLTKRSLPMQRHLHQCDVCCIVSDEGPYIAEFIHHYLYLGFSNIFVGLNNSTDKTEVILGKIASTHPNVHVLDVNDTQASFRQAGCYRVLFDYARNHSCSKYCLFVDVDEFWVADPFPAKIGDFLATRPVFDVHCFSWLICIGESPFSMLLSSSHSYSWNVHVKSMCSYDSDITDLRCHAPKLAHSNGICVLHGNTVSTLMNRMPDGLDISQKHNGYKALPINTPGIAWVFHRFNRSEIEYSYRLFKPHANQRGGHRFKTNRNGYALNSDTPGAKEYVAGLLPSDAVSSYHSSLAEFIHTCSLSADIEESRAGISEEAIYAKLDSLGPEVLALNGELLRKIFKATRFFEWVCIHT